MAESKKILRRQSELLDGVVGVFSPKKAFERKQYRFAYDAIVKSRTRKKRVGLGGTGDSHLTESNLYELREICREMCRNNPLVKGLLRTETDGVVGTGVKFQARTEDEGWNDEVEEIWKEEMVETACDVTGRHCINKVFDLCFHAYRRDGDSAVILSDNGPQVIEGEQMGTPSGMQDFKHFEVTNGVAVSKKTQRVIGYYIGRPSKWGYIKQDSYSHYPADSIYHAFNPDRSSQSRGEPAMTPAIDAVDKLCGYIDAELVAAKVNACFSMFIAQNSPDIPSPYTKGVSSTGRDADTQERYERIEPGIVMYGEPGESAAGIGQQRPGTLFDPFVLRMLSLIGRPLCLPLMLVTLDFSGATFMNARIAYQKVQEKWQKEQEFVLKPIARKLWRWKIDKCIEKGTLSDRPDKYRCDVICNRWPYVDPYKEAIADEMELGNRTTTRVAICARKGEEFREVAEQLGREEKILKEAGLNTKETGEA